MNKEYYTEKELITFKEIILEKMEKARKQLEYLKQSYQNGQGNRTDDTAPIFKSSVEEGAMDLEKEANVRTRNASRKIHTRFKSCFIEN